MYQCKHNRKQTRTGKRIGVQSVLMIVAVCMVLCSLIGGTVAWLSTSTDPVVNTFTYGDINIDLTETDVDNDDDPNNNTYKMIPGSTIEKDPKVTVKKNSEACWLFVKIEESTNAKFSDFLSYTVADGWTKLDTETESIVYYRAVALASDDLTYSVLKDDRVTVNTDATKAKLNALTAGTLPTLTFTAYAVQQENIDTAATAWSIAKGE